MTALTRTWPLWGVGSAQPATEGVDLSNMTENQRAQYERMDLKVPSTGVQLRSKRGLVIYMALAVPILAVLIWAAVAGIDHWWQGVVFGVICMTAVGMMIAISPNRKA